FLQCGAQCAEISRAGGFTQGKGYILIGGEIDLDWFSVLPVGGNLENGRTTQAQMGEQHLLAEVWLTERSADGEGNSSQLSERAAFPGGEQERHETGPRFDDGDSELAGNVVSETGRARFGDGESAGGDDQGWRKVLDGFGSY